MSDILHLRLSPSDDSLDSEVGDETVILNLKNGTYYGLDAVGTRIWSLLKEEMAPMDICRRLSADYGVPREVIDADVRGFLSELRANNIVVDA